MTLIVAGLAGHFLRAAALPGMLFPSLLGFVFVLALLRRDMAGIGIAGGICNAAKNLARLFLGNIRP